MGARDVWDEGTRIGCVGAGEGDSMEGGIRPGTGGLDLEGLVGGISLQGMAWHGMAWTRTWGEVQHAWINGRAREAWHSSQLGNYCIKSINFAANAFQMNLQD